MCNCRSVVFICSWVVHPGTFKIARLVSKKSRHEFLVLQNTMVPTTYLKSAIALIIRCHWHFSCQNVVCHFYRWNQITMKQTPPVILRKNGLSQKSMRLSIWGRWSKGSSVKATHDVCLYNVLSTMTLTYCSRKFIDVYLRATYHKKILNKNKAKRGTLYWDVFKGN